MYLTCGTLLDHNVRNRENSFYPLPKLGKSSKSPRKVSPRKASSVTKKPAKTRLSPKKHSSLPEVNFITKSDSPG